MVGSWDWRTGRPPWFWGELLWGLKILTRHDHGVLFVQVWVGANRDRHPDGPPLSEDGHRHHPQPGTNHSAQRHRDPGGGGRGEEGEPEDRRAAGSQQAEPTHQQVPEPSHCGRWAGESHRTTAQLKWKQWLIVCCPLTEIKQKKEKKQKGKDPEEKSTLQRSKTFVNLLFRGGRKRDTSRGRSKSPSTDKGRKGRSILHFKYI